MDPLSSLSNLPRLAAGVVLECDVARRELIRAGIQAWQDSDTSLPTIPWLGPVQLSWRYYLASKKQQLLLSFRRRPEQIDIALDSSLRFRVEPSPLPVPSLSGSSTTPPAPAESVPPLPANGGSVAAGVSPAVEGGVPPPGIPSSSTPPSKTSPSSAPPISRLSWPQFLGPSSPNLAVFHLRHRSDRRRLELPILKDAIHFPAARLFQGDDSIPLQQGNALLLEPLVDWIQTIGAWKRDPDANSSWRPLTPPADQESLPARRILASIVGTYQEACQAAANRSPGPLPPPPDAVDPLPHGQTIAEFTGMTWLRLQADGTAIAEKGSDDTTTLEMRYNLEHEDGRDRLDVRLQPPDFLISGDLHRQILSTVGQAALDANWHRPNGPLGRGTGVSEQEVQDLFAHADATVLRIERRRDRDRDLILLRGSLQGVQVWVVLTAWLAVGKPTDRQQPKTRTLFVSPPPPPAGHQGHGGPDLVNTFDKNNDAMTCLFVGERFTDDTVVPASVAKSFGRIMLAMHRWGGIWPPTETMSSP